MVKEDAHFQKDTNLEWDVWKEAKVVGMKALKKKFLLSSLKWKIKKSFSSSSDDIEWNQSDEHTWSENELYKTDIMENEWVWLLDPVINMLSSTWVEQTMIHEFDGLRRKNKERQSALHQDWIDDGLFSAYPYTDFENQAPSWSMWQKFGSILPVSQVRWWKAWDVLTGRDWERIEIVDDSFYEKVQRAARQEYFQRVAKQDPAFKSLYDQRNAMLSRVNIAGAKLELSDVNGNPPKNFPAGSKVDQSALNEWQSKFSDRQIEKSLEKYKESWFDEILHFGRESESDPDRNSPDRIDQTRSEYSQFIKDRYDPSKMEISLGGSVIKFTEKSWRLQWGKDGNPIGTFDDFVLHEDSHNSLYSPFLLIDIQGSDPVLIKTLADYFPMHQLLNSEIEGDIHFSSLWNSEHPARLNIFFMAYLLAKTQKEDYEKERTQSFVEKTKQWHKEKIDRHQRQIKNPDENVIEKILDSREEKYRKKNPPPTRKNGKLQKRKLDAYEWIVQEARDLERINIQRNMLARVEWGEIVFRKEHLIQKLESKVKTFRWIDLKLDIQMSPDGREQLIRAKYGNIHPWKRTKPVTFTDFFDSPELLLETISDPLVRAQILTLNKEKTDLLKQEYINEVQWMERHEETHRLLMYFDVHELHTKKTDGGSIVLSEEELCRIAEKDFWTNSAANYKDRNIISFKRESQGSQWWEIIEIDLCTINTDICDEINKKIKNRTGDSHFEGAPWTMKHYAQVNDTSWFKLLEYDLIGTEDSTVPDVARELIDFGAYDDVDGLLKTLYEATTPEARWAILASLQPLLEQVTSLHTEIENITTNAQTFITNVKKSISDPNATVFPRQSTETIEKMGRDLRQKHRDFQELENELVRQIQLLNDSDHPREYVKSYTDKLTTITNQVRDASSRFNNLATEFEAWQQNVINNANQIATDLWNWIAASQLASDSVSDATSLVTNSPRLKETKESLEGMKKEAESVSDTQEELEDPEVVSRREFANVFNEDLKWDPKVSFNADTGQFQMEKNWMMQNDPDGMLLYFRTRTSSLPGHGTSWMKGRIIPQNGGTYVLELVDGTEWNPPWGERIVRKITGPDLKWLLGKFRWEIYRARETNSLSDVQKYLQDWIWKFKWGEVSWEAWGKYFVNPETSKKTWEVWFEPKTWDLEYLWHYRDDEKYDFYKITNNWDTVTVTSLKKEKPWSNTMDWTSLAFFVKDKKLTPHNEQEYQSIQEKYEAPKDEPKGKRSDSLLSISAVLAAVKKFPESFKHYFAEREKYQSAKLYAQLAEKMPEIYRLYTNDVKADALAELDSEIWKVINGHKDRLWRTDGDGSWVHKKQAAIRIEREIFKEVRTDERYRHKAAWYLLYALDQWNMYYRELSHYKHTWMWVKALLGEKHKDIFLKKRKQFHDKLRNLWYEEEEAFNDLIMFEIQYIADGTTESSLLHLYGSKFGKSVESFTENEGNDIERQKEAIWKKWSYYETYKTVRWKIDKQEPGGIVWGIELLLEWAETWQHYRMLYSLIMQWYTSGVIPYVLGNKWKWKLKQLWRTYGIPLLIMAKDIHAQRRVTFLMDNIAQQAWIQSFSNYVTAKEWTTYDVTSYHMHNFSSMPIGHADTFDGTDYKNSRHVKTVKNTEEWMGEHGDTIIDALNFKNDYYFQALWAAEWDVKSDLEIYYNGKVHDPQTSVDVWYSKESFKQWESPHYSQWILNIGYSTFKGAMRETRWWGWRQELRNDLATDMWKKMRQNVEGLDSSIWWLSVAGDWSGSSAKYMLHFIVKKFFTYFGTDMDDETKKKVTSLLLWQTSSVQDVIKDRNWTETGAKELNLEGYLEKIILTDNWIDKIPVMKEWVGAYIKLFKNHRSLLSRYGRFDWSPWPHLSDPYP